MRASFFILIARLGTLAKCVACVLRRYGQGKDAVQQRSGGWLVTVARCGSGGGGGGLRAGAVCMQTRSANKQHPVPVLRFVLPRTYVLVLYVHTSYGIL